MEYVMLQNMDPTFPVFYEFCQKAGTGKNAGRTVFQSNLMSKKEFVVAILLKPKVEEELLRRALIKIGRAEDIGVVLSISDLTITPEDDDHGGETVDPLFTVVGNTNIEVCMVNQSVGDFQFCSLLITPYSQDANDPDR